MIAPSIIGIDSGSTMCKAVLFQDNKVVEARISKTGWDPKLSAQEHSDKLLELGKLSPSEVIFSTTGYGREAIDFAEHIFTEITCHAFGGMHLAPQIQGIVDIGGQDSKVIKIRDGKIIDFLMNDKCAAGTGRFLSMACDTMGIELSSIDDFVTLDEFIPINSMCTVFAESEIIGLLSMQKERSQILAGVLHSIAQRVGQMINRMGFDPKLPLLMTGGLSRSRALLEAIAQSTALQVITHEQAPFAGAIGACICAYDRWVKEEREEF